MADEFKTLAKNLGPLMVVNGKVVNKVIKKDGKVRVFWVGISKPSVYYENEYVR